MKDEDMDPTAFEDITKVLYSSGARILSKGTSGRHNDDHSTATAWFLNFYRMILENEFWKKGMNMIHKNNSQIQWERM